MGTVDPFGITDKLSDTLLQAIVMRLEARGKHQFFMTMLQEYLDVMHIDTASTVLDMGCGTGIAARTIARRPAFAGKVLGIDLSPSLAETARQLAIDEGVGDRVEFRAGTRAASTFHTRRSTQWSPTLL